MMPHYLLLLYRTDAEAGSPERKAEGPLWEELNRSLREAGLLVSDARLHPVTTATTVRVREGEVELTDGPFATTKEVLAGYYLIRCGDLDDALKHAARVPLAGYGSVEVRPVADPGAPRPDEEGGRVDEPAEPTVAGPAVPPGGAATAV
jgi:hypothetical protein